MKRAIVYTDEFNLYYGALKGSSSKWIDLRAMVQRHVGDDFDILKVNYFTARVADDPNDRNRSQRQDVYLRAFHAMGVEVVLGEMKRREFTARLAREKDRSGRIVFSETIVRVERHEEKKTDVALATAMVTDAALDAYDWAILVTNDSDQVPAIAAITSHFNKRVYILNPHPKNRESAEMRGIAHRIRKIDEKVLKSCQMPDRILDGEKVITRPPYRT